MIIRSSKISENVYFKFKYSGQLMQLANTLHLDDKKAKSLDTIYIPYNCSKIMFPLSKISRDSRDIGIWKHIPFTPIFTISS